MYKIKVVLLILMIFMSCKRRNVKITPSDAIEDVYVTGVQVNPEDEKIIIESSRRNRFKKERSTVVKMSKFGSVYEIPVKINGVNMDFIFDTGAGGISISETEVMFLAKQGKILEEDIIGSINTMDATGAISEGTEINLRKVQIGDRVLENVRASVVDNSIAPILLGQTALSRFGKVIIDYNRMEITFE